MDPGGGNPSKEEATIQVPSKGGGPPEESKEPQLPPGPNPELTQDDKGMEGMSQEDRELKERLELAVERCKDENAEIQRAAMELLKKEIRESTSSMTAVPKPLKFLTPHWATLKGLYESMPAAHSNKVAFADIMSVLAMTMGVEGARESLKYKLAGHPTEVGEWGHEYVRALAGEVGAEYNDRVEKAEEANKEAKLDDLLGLVKVIVPFNMSHNAEPEAVDLLLEVGQLPLLLEGTGVDEHSYQRVCAYLLKCADYLGDPDESSECMETAYKVFTAQQQYPDALRVALAIGGADVDSRVKEVFDACTDAGVRRQMAYILGRQRVNFVSGDDAIDGLIGNNSLSELFAALARDLDVVEAKTPEDIYKTSLIGSSSETGGGEKIDSARANLASTIVNAFVNAGYGTDKLMTPENSTWVYKNKDQGQLAAGASLGMLHLWNDNQLSSLDKLLYAPEDSVKAGALLGIGLCCTGTRNLDADPAFALLSEHLDQGSTTSSTAMRSAAALGLGLAYAGSRREEVASLFVPFVQDTSASASMELASTAALALGLVFVGSGNEEYAAIIADRLMESNDAEAGQAIARHMALGLGLLFLGREGEADAILEILSTIEKPLGRVAHILVQSCAYAATGNVLKIQGLLRMCAEHPEMEDREREEKEAVEKAEKEATERAAAGAAGSNAAGGAGAGASNAAGAGAGSAAAGGDDKSKEKDSSSGAAKYMYQSAAVLGLAMVAMGEELSVQLASRMAEHLQAYGDQSVKRVVPLALALCHVSDPVYEVVDVLSKASHDPHEDTAMAGIFGMGLVGAGTNNSRIAGLLRTLSTFYKNEANMLFVVRLAQAMLHMGKGLMTVNPFHSDRGLTSHVALASIIATVTCGLDFKSTLLGKIPHFMYILAAAMQPKFVCTVSETGEAIPVEVRVGQAVETVGQAGRPKTITGFQTHTTPVLMGVSDRCELGDEQYIPLTSVLEGVVVLRANPNFKGKKLTDEERKEQEKRNRLAMKGGGGRADLRWE